MMTQRGRGQGERGKKEKKKREARNLRHVEKKGLKTQWCGGVGKSREGRKRNERINRPASDARRKTQEKKKKGGGKEKDRRIAPKSFHLCFLTGTTSLQLSRLRKRRGGRKKKKGCWWHRLKLFTCPSPAV